MEGIYMAYEKKEKVTVEEAAKILLDNPGQIHEFDMLLSNKMLSLYSEFYSERDIPGRLFGTDIIEVIPYARNFDNDCRDDFINEKGIRIQNPEAFDKKNAKTEDGLQSPFFGSDFGDDLAFAERYTCVCGKLKGQMYEHRYCPECNTEVQYNDIDLTKTGWIIIDKFEDQEFCVINPLYYAKLEKVLGKLDNTEKVIAAIIKIHYKDRKGNDILNNPDDPCLDDKDIHQIEKHPYIRRGMSWFRNNIREVLMYYRKKKPPKQREAIDEILNNLDKVFCRCIPVYSSVLRIETPGEKGDKIYKQRTNKCYQSIIRSVNKINKLLADSAGEKLSIEETTLIDRFLCQIQADLREEFEEEFNSINDKKGHIQARVIAGRVNWSARNIIIAGNEVLHANEMLICYASFIELYRYELINIYSKWKNCTLSEASSEVQIAKSHFNNEIYFIMKWMVDTHDLYLLVNRNPSINFGSFNRLRIAAVKPDIDDKTVTLNRRVLQTMGADFDGDQVNIFRVIGEVLNDKFNENMDPVRNLYISRINGRLNRGMTPAKDEAIGFFVFNNV